MTQRGTTANSPQQPTAHAGPGAAVRYLDLLAIAGAVGCMLYLALRNPPPEFFEYFESPSQRWTGYGGAALIAASLLLVARRSRRIVSVSRLLGYGVAGLLAAATASRLLTPPLPIRFPPILPELFTGRLQDASPLDRASWGANVVAHHVANLRVATSRGGATPSAPQSGSLLEIPASWTFPSDVTVAIDERNADTLWIWARSDGGGLTCVSVPARARPPLCDKSRASDPALDFRKPVRVPASALPESLTAVAATGTAWPQYRGDAGKTGLPSIDTSATPPITWLYASDGEYRSTASVVGQLALIGNHGTGTLTALDVRTGKPAWVTRVPNWVHQDIISDGRTALVGFGDNDGSLWGRAPSGVSAYDVATGAHRWTVFDESSVMTSGVIEGDAIVYGTAAGVVRRRRLADGQLLGEHNLDGGVIMAPPASLGDTVVFSLDHASVCALTISTVSPLWCDRFHGLLVGHSGPAIAHGVVMASVVVALRDISFSDLTRQTLKQAWSEVWSNVVLPTKFVGQKVVGIELRSGKVLWETRVFGMSRLVEGHTSGTPVVDGNTGVVVLPVTDSIIAFNVADGAVRWTAGAHQARGPSLIVDGKIIVAGRDGITEVRSVATGELTCTMKRKVGFDRAGPTLADGTLLFADLKGTIEAIPLRAFLTCDTSLLADHTPSRPSPSTTHNGH